MTAAGADADRDPGSIAVIGMAGRFPGARDCAALWKLVAAGTEAISRFSDEELAVADVPPAIRRDPRYVPARGVIEDAWCFDAEFFGYTPREAQRMDPQHRLFLEACWTALESAGHAPPLRNPLCGVWAGSGFSSYHTRMFARGLSEGLVDDVDLMLGSEKGFLSTRVSYKLGLEGPSLDVQTACSTSLVAICFACQSLLAYQCDMALAGGVSVVLPQRAGYMFTPGMIYSPDGSCRAFDVGAQGCVGSNGLAVVVLKRLEDAIADGDPIRSVIRGFAVTNDGGRKVGFTAPSSLGQERAIREAMSLAQVRPEDISYIEAHGTGTPLGDVVEIEGLRRAFAADGRSGACAIGSLKTNIGHLDAAAGAAGLIKATLALEHRLIPPNANFREPNPALRLDGSPFRVSDRLRPWRDENGPLRCGVSSFGLGGTNAHVILEEGRALAAPAQAEGWQTLTLSAKTKAALAAQGEALARTLSDQPRLDIGQVAATLQTGRAQFGQRAATAARNPAEAAQALRAAVRSRITEAPPDGGRIAFLIPGGGAQHPGMAAGLHREEAAFRDRIEPLFAYLSKHHGLDVRKPSLDPTFDPRALARPGLGLPALFSVELAFARMLMGWGLVPEAMLGHSLGEYVAATLSGVMRDTDALDLVVARGALFERLAPGGMLSVALPEDDLRPYLSGDLTVAAVNGPRDAVLSGSLDTIGAAQRRLRKDGIDARAVPIDVAAHSPLLDPILPAFGEAVRRIGLQPPRLPFASNVTGTWITETEATDPEYWVSHLRQPVRFWDGLNTLLAGGARLLMEVGPGRTLTELARRTGTGDRRRVDAIPMMRHPQDPEPDHRRLAEALGAAWACGASVDWTARAGGSQPRKVPLSGYAFARTEHRSVIANPDPLSARGRSPDPAPEISRWFWLPHWRPASRLPASKAQRKETWLWFAPGEQEDDPIGAALASACTDLVTVRQGVNFAREGDAIFRLRRDAPGEHKALIDCLTQAGRPPRRIAHGWSLEAPADTPDSEAALGRGCRDILYVIQALAAQQPKAGVRLLALCQRALRPAEIGPASPLRADLLGPCLTAPQELDWLTALCVDIDDPGNSARDVAAELLAETKPGAVSYRDGRRNVLAYAGAGIDESWSAAAPLRRGGRYLITGGFGDVGETLARHLAAHWGARLALVGRTSLEGEGIQACRRRGLLDALKTAGAEEAIGLVADCTDEGALGAALDTVRRRYGGIDGVIHCAAEIDRATVFRAAVETDAADVATQFRAKVGGALTLDRVLAGEPLDFALLVSSNAALLGGLGLSAYSSANAVINAIAATGSRWRAITWDGWPRRRDGPAEGRTGIDAYALNAQQAAMAFECAIAAEDQPWVAVSTGDLSARSALCLAGAAEVAALEPDLPATDLPRALASGAKAPRNEIEAGVAAMLSNLMGIEEIGVHDDFFELGGSSLLATRLVARLCRRFEVDLSLRSFFAAPTVAGIAEAIVLARAAAADPDTVAQLLDAFESSERLHGGVTGAIADAVDG